MIDLYTWKTPNGRKVSICSKNSACPIRRMASTSARTSSSSRNSCRSVPTTAFRRSSIATAAFSLMESGAILHLSRRQDRQAPAEGGRAALSRDRMADVADGRHRADARPSASFREIQQRQGALRRRALPQGGAPALRRARPPPRRPRLRRRRLFDRRHRDLALDLALRMADDRSSTMPNVKRWYVAIANRPAVRERLFCSRRTSGPIPMPQ